MDKRDLIGAINRNKLPRHVAFIMDGNGRWATQRNKSRLEGHRAAFTAIDDVVEGCLEVGIEIATFFAFSRENWNRPPGEVRGLMNLVEDFFHLKKDKYSGYDIIFHHIGSSDGLPPSVRQIIDETVELTKGNKGKLVVNMALNYSGRWEIAQASAKLAEDVLRGKLKPADVNEATFERYLFTYPCPDPDLLIRTSGEMRISNFLLWQIAYTEIWITPVLWPDFRREHLYQAILDYQRRDRRYGAI
ncbi:MAG: polyprenyl diphosphate synthase [bacterium]